MFQNRIQPSQPNRFHLNVNLPICKPAPSPAQEHVAVTHARFACDSCTFTSLPELWLSLHAEHNHHLQLRNLFLKPDLPVIAVGLPLFHFTPWLSSPQLTAQGELSLGNLVTPSPVPVLSPCCPRAVLTTPGGLSVNLWFTPWLPSSVHHPG